MANLNVLFTFNVPKDLKDDVIDILINSELASGFNLIPMLGYSNAHSSFNIEEQVQGCKNMFQFDVLVEQTKVIELKAVLKNAFHTAGLRYWLTPVVETGHL